MNQLTGIVIFPNNFARLFVFFPLFLSLSLRFNSARRPIHKQNYFCHRTKAQKLETLKNVSKTKELIDWSHWRCCSPLGKTGKTPQKLYPPVCVCVCL